MLLPHLFLTLPIEVYPATNVRKNFAITKFWQIFILSHSLPLPPPAPPIVMGGGPETMYNQITHWNHTTHALD